MAGRRAAIYKVVVTSMTAGRAGWDQVVQDVVLMSIYTLPSGQPLKENKVGNGISCQAPDLTGTPYSIYSHFFIQTTPDNHNLPSFL
jgi:hypothetical protein